ncbi:MAG: hypothetical protein KAX49_14275 [Halanaerobiales bacterium]|nr:hypothetical protein [Halanaerobiales bacterium]
MTNNRYKGRMSNGYGRESDRLIVLMKPGNADGEKEIATRLSVLLRTH